MTNVTNFAENFTEEQINTVSFFSLNKEIKNGYVKMTIAEALMTDYFTTADMVYAIRDIADNMQDTDKNYADIDQINGFLCDFVDNEENILSYIQYVCSDRGFESNILDFYESLDDEEQISEIESELSDLIEIKEFIDQSNRNVMFNIDYSIFSINNFNKFDLYYELNNDLLDVVIGFEVEF